MTRATAGAAKNLRSVMGSSEIRLGRYRHYKGGEYEVIGVATLEETGEPMVVYRALYGEKNLWTRPLQVFTEVVEVPEFKYKGPRFTYVGE